ncbi:hypothetical protein OMDBNIEC_00026 [Salmonella phage STP-SP5]|nr:hypothetical protein OMDBNIEC_00026 [Salmonella phage STP-SP5]
MNINKQAPEARDTKNDGMYLDVHSVFSTIQGEGPFCGEPAVFVRLAGCNLQCPGCDTDYTTGRTRYDLVDIIKLIESRKIETGSKTSLVVITGGEPFRQAINPFVEMLLLRGYEVQIETNGSMPLPHGFSQLPTIVCSPKTAKIHPSILHRANAFKYVIKAGNVNQDDGLPLQALDHRATPFIARPTRNFKSKIYLQPMDEQDKFNNYENIRQVVDSCMKHGYTVQLQVHKYLGVE